MLMSDGVIAAIGRDLAVALSRRARSRSTEDQKLVLALQTELCAAVFGETENSDQGRTKFDAHPVDSPQ
jgi:hypothetical protein